MIAALLNQQGGVGQTTLALQLAWVGTRGGKRHHFVIDGPLHVARSMLAAELGLTPEPSSLDGWAVGEILRLGDARAFHPVLVARLAVGCPPAGAIITRETAPVLPNHEPPMLSGRISQRVTFADAARSRGLREVGPATREIAAFQRGLIVAELPRALLDREAPDGGAVS